MGLYPSKHLLYFEITLKASNMQCHSYLSIIIHGIQIKILLVAINYFA